MGMRFRLLGAVLVFCLTALPRPCPSSWINC